MSNSLLRWILAACLFTPAVQAQTYEPGWVLRSSGDTLKGEVENAFWVEPPTFIRFRPNAASPSELFRPRQLRAVGFRGGRYFRYEALPIDHAAQTNLVSLPRGNKTDVQTDSLLAEVLLEGHATLFRVVRPGTTHYLIQQAGRPVLELSERKYLRAEANGTWVIADGNNYRAQLTLYFGDCPAARDAAQTTEFTTSDLVTLVQAYNQQCGPTRQPGRSYLAQPQALIPRRKLAFMGGLLAGLRYNRIESPSANIAGPCVDCGVHPFAGLYAELLRPGRNLAIYGELSGSKFNSQVREFAGYNSQNSTYLFSRVDYQAWLGTARLGLRYFFPLPQEWQWFITAGYELNFVFSPRVTGTTSPPPLYADDVSMDKYAAPSLLPHLGLGLRSQRFTLSLDGQAYKSVAPENDGTFFFANYALRLGLGYRLSRHPDQAR
ncbi:hypothetical protein GCM10023185_35610 [Hymenobacter saemangeumensis]|uniref:Outer membrane protein beta-barrel domain-containing protein n=1 Tax=Hymenobacter saemangeumensis TaxID=1084522 RepID=A0ABP8IPK2_9BACT